MSHQISKKEAAQQQVQQQGQYARDTETQEHHSSANAQVCMHSPCFSGFSLSIRLQTQCCWPAHRCLPTHQQLEFVVNPRCQFNFNFQFSTPVVVLVFTLFWSSGCQLSSLFPRLISYCLSLQPVSHLSSSSSISSSSSSSRSPYLVPFHPRVDRQWYYKHINIRN